MSPSRDDGPPSSDDGSESDRNGNAPADRRAVEDSGTDQRDSETDQGEDDTRGQDRVETRRGPRSADDGDQSRPEDGAQRREDDARQGQSDAARQGQPGGDDTQRQRPSDGRSARDRPDAPPAQRAGTNEDRDDGWITTFVVDVGSSALAVLLVGFFLFTVSGVWPPMVAVESASMTPQMKTGDLVFVMEEQRFPGDGAHEDTGVVTARAGAEVGYEQFSRPGDVVVYEPDGNGDRTPIIHRAMFWVEEGERWYDQADPDAVGSADSCEELANCPAPYAGFITKGDANTAYDQVGPNPHSGPVRSEWIVGTAEARVPWLGCVRLPSKDCTTPLSTASSADTGFALPSVDTGFVAPSVDLTVSLATSEAFPVGPETPLAVGHAGVAPAVDLSVPDAAFVDGLA